MSRQFSYNDENFTVIGNVLFIHFKFEKSASIGSKLIEIPPKIFDRLLFYSNSANTCNSVLEEQNGSFSLSIKEDNGKHYFYNNTYISADANRYIFSIFILKDI